MSPFTIVIRSQGFAVVAIVVFVYVCFLDAWFVRLCFLRSLSEREKEGAEAGQLCIKRYHCIIKEEKKKKEDFNGKLFREE